MSDWGSNSIVLYDPATKAFSAYPIPTPDAEVRQLLGRPGEVWGAESGPNKLLVIRHEGARP